MRFQLSDPRAIVLGEQLPRPDPEHLARLEQEVASAILERPGEAERLERYRDIAAEDDELVRIAHHRPRFREFGYQNRPRVYRGFLHFSGIRFARFLKVRVPESDRGGYRYDRSSYFHHVQIHIPRTLARVLRVPESGFRQKAACLLRIFVEILVPDRSGLWYPKRGFGYQNPRAGRGRDRRGRRGRSG